MPIQHLFRGHIPTDLHTRPDLDAKRPNVLDLGEHLVGWHLVRGNTGRIESSRPLGCFIDDRVMTQKRKSPGTGE